MKVLLDASRRNSDVSSAARDSLRTIARQARPACEKLTNQFPELKVFLDQTRPPPTKTTNKH
jgi:hypothetical protein